MRPGSITCNVWEMDKWLNLSLSINKMGIITLTLPISLQQALSSIVRSGKEYLLNERISKWLNKVS